VRVFEVEKAGKTSLLREHPLPAQAADDLVAFAERLLPIKNDDLEPLHASGRSRAGAWYVVDDRSTIRAHVAEKGPYAEAAALGSPRALRAHDGARSGSPPAAVRARRRGRRAPDARRGARASPAAEAGPAAARADPGRRRDRLRDHRRHPRGDRGVRRAHDRL